MNFLKVVAVLCFFVFHATVADEHVELFRAIENDNLQRFQELLKLGNLENRGLANIKFKSNWTLLHIAAHFSSQVIVDYVLSEQQDERRRTEFKNMIEAEDDDGRTPIFFAVTSSAPSATKVSAILLSFGANGLHRDNQGMEPVHLVVQQRNLAGINSLFGNLGSKASESNYNGKTISHLVAQHNFYEFLEKFGTFFNATALDSQGQIPACYAAHFGSLEVGKAMLERQENIATGKCVYSQQDEQIVGSPLHVAAYNGQISYAEYLINNGGADLNDRDSLGGSVLHAMVRQQRQKDVDSAKKFVIMLCDKVPKVIYWKDDLGRTPFLTAAATGAESLEEVLRIKCVPDLKEVDRYGFSAMHLAASGRFFITMLSFNGTLLNETASEEMLTPLLAAVKFHRDRLVIRIMLNYGANRNAVNVKNQTAAHIAVEVDHPQAIDEMLISKDNKALSTAFSMRDSRGRTPFLLAIQLGRSNIAENMAKELGVNELNQVMPVSGDTCIHLASRTKMFNVVEILKTKVSTETPNFNGQTPLHIAVQVQNVDMINFLVVKMNTSIMRKDNGGRAPLHYAVRSNRKAIKIVDLLMLSIDRNATATAIYEPNENGETALSLAVKRNAGELAVHLLKKYNMSCEETFVDGLTPLFLAKKQGCDSVVSALIGSGVCLSNQTDICGNTISDISISSAEFCFEEPYFLNGIVSNGSSCVGSLRNVTCLVPGSYLGVLKVVCNNEGIWESHGTCPTNVNHTTERGAHHKIGEELIELTVKTLKSIDCEEIKSVFPETLTGFYLVQPHTTNAPSLNVLCDMDRYGGGWTVIQQRGDEQPGENAFKNDWVTYMSGFGDNNSTNKSLWLGNNAIHQLTNQAAYQLLIGMAKPESDKFNFAVHSNFSIDNKDANYRLHIGNFACGDGIASQNAFYQHNGALFSTYDRDYDNSRDFNCAAKEGGGWWYTDCSFVNLNEYPHGTWYHGKGEVEVSRTFMMIRRAPKC